MAGKGIYSFLIKEISRWDGFVGVSTIGIGSSKEEEVESRVWIRYSGMCRHVAGSFGGGLDRKDGTWVVLGEYDLLAGHLLIVCLMEVLVVHASLFSLSKLESELERLECRSLR